MGGAFIAYLVSVFFVAVLTRDSYGFVLLYLFSSAFLISRWWLSRTSNALRFERKYENHAFPEETIPVTLIIHNPSRLPVLWLQAQESLDLEISPQKIIRRVFSLPPGGKETLQYFLTPQKRGYYALGPLLLSSGDLLGLVSEKTISGERDYITIFPKVIPLSRPRIPSHSPLGNLRYEQPIFEDPTRSIGKRDYTPGDTLRRIDWKSSAAVGRLQTRLYEPSISLETVLCLNLNADEYHHKFRYNAMELAIVVAASLANWAVSQKQSVGLLVNGSDPLAPTLTTPQLAVRKGRAHLMHLLEILARIQLTATQPMHQVLHRKHVEYNWGTTLIVMTGQADEALFGTFFQLRRSGLNIVLILCGDAPGSQSAKLRSETFKIPYYHIQTELDLDIWRK